MRCRDPPPPFFFYVDEPFVQGGGEVNSIVYPDAYWLIGSLSNNSATLSHYSSWYKSTRWAAAAIVWCLDGLKISYRSMYLSTWILLDSVCTTFFVAFMKVKEHSEDEVRDEVRDLVGEVTGIGPGVVEIAKGGNLVQEETRTA